MVFRLPAPLKIHIFKLINLSVLTELAQWESGLQSRCPCDFCLGSDLSGVPLLPPPRRPDLSSAAFPQAGPFPLDPLILLRSQDFYRLGQSLSAQAITLKNQHSPER